MPGDEPDPVPSATPAWAPARWWEPLGDAPAPGAAGGVPGVPGVVAVGALVDLRRAVLRDGRADLHAGHPADPDPSTLHLGAVSPGGPMVGGVTVVVEPWPGYATLHLVLMAVDAGWRRRGVGASLVRAVQDSATAAGFDVWAAARTGVLDFYADLGFRPLGDEFTGAMDLAHRRVLWRRP